MTNSRPEHGNDANVVKSKRTHAKDTASPTLRELEDRVVIGMDPYKRSVTIEVMAGDETMLGGGRFATDRDGFQQMQARAKAGPRRAVTPTCSDASRAWFPP